MIVARLFKLFLVEQGVFFCIREHVGRGSKRRISNVLNNDGCAYDVGERDFLNAKDFA